MSYPTSWTVASSPRFFCKAIMVCVRSGPRSPGEAGNTADRGSTLVHFSSKSRRYHPTSLAMVRRTSQWQEPSRKTHTLGKGSLYDPDIKGNLPLYFRPFLVPFCIPTFLCFSNLAVSMLLFYSIFICISVS